MKIAPFLILIYDKEYMEKEILEKLKVQEEKIEKIYNSVEKTRKYFLVTIIATAVMFILPVIVLIVMIPRLISIYSDIFNF